MKRLFINLSSFIILISSSLFISACNGGNNNNNDVPPIPESGIIFGNEQGYVYKDHDVIIGESHISSLASFHRIKNIITDNNGTLYAVVDINDEIQTIWKKEFNDTIWIPLTGNGKEGSINGTAVSSITTDKNNNLYAVTSDGYLFLYSNELKAWNNLGRTSLTSRNTLSTSIEDTVYVATSYGSIWSYKNNILTNESFIPNLPYNTSLTAIVGTSKGVFISYDNGQIYQYNNKTFSLYKSLDPSSNIITNLAYNEQTQTLYASAVIFDVNRYPSYQVIKVNPDSTPYELLGQLARNVRINSILVKNNTIFIGIQNAYSTMHSDVYFFNSTAKTWDQYGDNIEADDDFIGSETYIAYDELHNKFYATATDPEELRSNVYNLDENTQHWQIVGSGTINGQPIYALLQSANDLYITTNNGYTYKYNKQNKSLTTLVSNDKILYLNSLAIVNDNLYAGDMDITGNNVHIYNKATESWDLFQQLYSDESSQAIYKTTLYNYNNTFYATASVDEFTGTVWRFESTINQMTILSGEGNESSIDNSAPLSLVVESNNIYVGTSLGQVWMLASESNTWTKVGGYMDYSAITTLSFNANKQLYAGTTNGRIFKLDSKLGKWVASSIYLDNSEIMSLVTDGSGNQFAVTKSGNIFLNNNDSWINIHMGNGSQIISQHAVLGIK